MKPNKREVLKRLIKINLLAEITSINAAYLSQIINGHRSASDDLSQRLANAANRLSYQDDFFKPADFKKE